jgi:hypothetical protein
MVVEQNETIELIFDHIDNLMKESKPVKDEFKKAFKIILNYKENLQKKIEFAISIYKDDTNYYRLYNNIAGSNSCDLMDKLRNLGFILMKGNDQLRKDFENAGFRLLELTRAGKKDEVYYRILRIFLSNKKEMPKYLIEPFKPIYSDEMFKVFIFSFLSGILQKTENEQ